MPESVKRPFGITVSDLAGILVLSIFVIHPLAVGPQGNTTLEQVKHYTFMALFCYAALAIGAVAVVIRIRRCPSDVKGFTALRHTVRPYEYAMLAYFIALVISTCLAYDPRIAFGGINYRGESFIIQTMYLLTAALAARFYRVKERDLLIFCAVAALVAGYGILQFYGMDFLGFYDGSSRNPGRDFLLISTMSNRNLAAYYFGMALCVSSVMFTRRDGRLRWVFFAAACVMFYTILITMTRGAYVGLLTAAAVFFPFIARTRRDAARLCFLLSSFSLLWCVYVRLYAAAGFGTANMAFLTPYVLLLAVLFCAAGAALFYSGKLAELTKLPRKAAVAGWYILLVVLLAAALINMSALAEATGDLTLWQISEMLKGNISDDFGTMRIYPWRKALEFAAERPVFGWGPDNFGVVFNERYMIESFARFGQTYDKAHSEPLQILVSSGAVGLAGLLAYFGLVFYSVRKRLHEPMVLGVAAAMLCYFVHSLFAFSTPITHPVIWCMWGVLAGMGAGGLKDGRV